MDPSNEVPTDVLPPFFPLKIENQDETTFRDWMRVEFFPYLPFVLFPQDSEYVILWKWPCFR